MEEISLNAFEKSVAAGIKPKLKKPAFSVEKSDYRVLSITELVTKNFNKNRTSDVTGYFVINVNGKEHKIVVDTVTIKVLESVFRTTGRLPEEMKAICFFQAELINNIESAKAEESREEIKASGTSTQSEKPNNTSLDNSKAEEVQEDKKQIYEDAANFLDSGGE